MDPSEGTEPAADAADHVPHAVRAACAILALEAAALVVAGGFEVWSTIAGHASEVLRALLGAAFALAGAAALLAGARGLLALRPAARTPMVVIQLLALPVSYSLAFQADRVAWGGPILVAALAVLYLLFTPPARLALDRGEPL